MVYLCRKKVMKTSFNLSSVALEIIEEKARKFGVPVFQVVEWMVQEFSPSTEMEKRVSAMWKRKWREKYFDDKDQDDHMVRAWMNGFNVGWRLFQLRKANSLYKKFQESETKRCIYCGEEMEDLGDSWFCKNSDCVNNKPEPKKIKRYKGRGVVSE
jgi:hypothetical protein